MQAGERGEQALAAGKVRLLCKAGEQGIHDLEGLVAYLNQSGPRGPDGAAWTADTFQAEMARLGQ